MRARGADRGGEFEITGIADASVRWADLRLAHGQVLELIEYVDPARPAEPAEPNDPGATHISLRVADVDAVYERLREAGRESWSASRSRSPRPGGWEGARVFYSSDPDGVSVELIQPAGGSG